MTHIGMDIHQKSSTMAWRHPAIGDRGLVRCYIRNLRLKIDPASCRCAETRSPSAILTPPHCNTNFAVATVSIPYYCQ